MKNKQWSEYTNEEKLIAINAYLEGVANFDDPAKENNQKQVDWLRAHIPSYKPENGKPYIFISYSHRDAKQVYSDLAGFLYNSKRKVRFWYDEGLPIGEDWEEVAGKYLSDENCAGVLFYLSKNLLLSPSVYKEIETVKRVGKRYCSVALNPLQPSAEEIFDTAIGGELRTIKGKQEALEEFFPKKNTAMLHYGEEWDIEYRIDKISEIFNVTEEVLSEFIFIDVEDGLRLVEYCGNKTDVYIPEEINGIPITEISCDFPYAIKIYIPKTVKRISVKDDYIFPLSINLEEIKVDADNEVYFDLNGVLCDKKENIVLRAPSCWRWQNQFDVKNNEIPTAPPPIFLDYDISFVNTSYDVSDDDTLYETVTCQVDLADSYEALQLFAYLYLKIFEGEIEEDELNFYNNFVELLKNITDNNYHLYRVLYALKTRSIFKNIKGIAPYAFAHCVNLNYFFMPDNIKKIGFGAFCSSQLFLMVLSDNLKTIPEYCFGHCDRLFSAFTSTNYYKENSSPYGLREAILFGAINSIKENAFEGTCIHKVILNGNIKTIGAFSYCEQLEEVVFSEGTTHIGDFQNCERLKRIYVPITINEFTPSAFDGCNALCEVYFAGTMQEWEVHTYKEFDTGDSLQTQEDTGDEEIDIDDVDLEELFLRSTYIPRALKKATIYCSDGVIEPSVK